MNSTQQERLQRPQPSLVIKHGNSDKKFLSLDRAGTTLGRARGCDIELNAPEVSAVHCIITSGAGGFHVRDCNSRAGTHVNGRRVQESPLNDGDVLQVGPFSFEVHVPGVYLPFPDSAGVEGMSKARLQHILRSRRRLARLGLGLRRRLREQPAAPPAEPEVVSTNRLDVEAQAEALRNRVRHFEQKALQLEEAERRLAADRLTLTQEAADFRARVERTELELEQRRSHVEAECQARLAEYEERCRHLEQGTPGPEQPSAVETLTAEEARQLEQRRQELDEYARYLDQVREDLRRQDDGPARQRPAEMGDTPPPGEQQAGEKTPSTAGQGSEIDITPGDLGADTVLHGLCRDLAQTMADFHEIYQELAQHQNAELEGLRHAVVSLHHVLKERPPAASEVEAPGQDAGEMVESLRAEVNALREEVQRKEALIEEFRRRLEALASSGPRPEDFKEYEAELNANRRQLEQEREQLQEEIALVRARKTELDQALRDAELELSRDRAQIAHERAYLAQVREDVRLEQERAQRDRPV